MKDIDSKITELLLEEIDTFQRVDFDWDMKYRRIKEINKKFSKYPKEKVKNVIKYLEDKGYIEHLNLDVVQPKKSNIITILESEGGIIDIIPGEEVSAISQPKIARHTILKRSISNNELQRLYSKIFDIVFPSQCIVKVYNGHSKVVYPQQLAKLANVSDLSSDRIETLSLMGAKEVEKEREYITSKFSKKDAKFWFSGPITGLDRLVEMEPLLKKIKIYKSLMPIFDLFSLIEIWDKMPKPNVIFQFMDIGGSCYFRIYNEKYRQKILDCIKQFCSQRKLSIQIKTKNENT